MVIDSSALVAILLGEPELERLALSIAQDSKRLLSAFSRLEASIVMETRKGELGGRELELLIHRAGIDIVPLDEEQSAVALGAWRRYGKGRHPARLNIGDCCSYALAAVTGEPLLFKGDDFSRTDIRKCQY